MSWRSVLVNFDPGPQFIEHSGRAEFAFTKKNAKCPFVTTIILHLQAELQLSGKLPLDSAVTDGYAHLTFLADRNFSVPPCEAAIHALALGAADFVFLGAAFHKLMEGGGPVLADQEVDARVSRRDPDL